MAVEVEQDVQDNYRALVASGASTWADVVRSAERYGQDHLAIWAAAQARAEADVTEAPGPKARPKRTTGGE